MQLSFDQIKMSIHTGLEETVLDSRSGSCRFPPLCVRCIFEKTLRRTGGPSILLIIVVFTTWIFCENDLMRNTFDFVRQIERADDVDSQRDLLCCMDGQSGQEWHRVALFSFGTQWPMRFEKYGHQLTAESAVSSIFGSLKLGLFFYYFLNTLYLGCDLPWRDRPTEASSGWNLTADRLLLDKVLTIYVVLVVVRHPVDWLDHPLPSGRKMILS